MWPDGWYVEGEYKGLAQDLRARLEMCLNCFAADLLEKTAVREAIEELKAGSPPEGA